MSIVKNIIPYCLYLILVLWSINDGFFWDSVQLGSKHAHFYYSNNLSLQLLPDNINSGHLPVFGYYLALVWKIFGKSLLVSHLAMLPFSMGVVFYVLKLCQLRFAGPLFLLSCLLILFDPTLMSQVGLLGPDLPLICFFLACLYYHSKQQEFLKSIFLLLLAVISMRGMFLVAAFFLFELVIERKKLNYLIKNYGVSFLVIIVFFIIHYYSKAWIAFHSDSPWSESFAIDKIGSILKKPFIIIWRLIDFNRWIIFLLTAIFGYRLFKADRKLYMITSELYLLGIITLIFGIVATLFSGLTAHRYFLPINILLSLYFLRLLSVSMIALKTKKLILTSSIIILALGHLLIYPPSIDQGWDASLAHKPYFKLMSEVETYLSQNNIDKQSVCTAFPDLAQGKYYTLTDDESSFSRLSSNDCEYILISNIHNEIEPAEFDGQKVIIEWEKFGVWYRLMETSDF